MARTVVLGMNEVLKNIQRELMAVKGATVEGMFYAMKFLENEMDTVNPVVPYRTGEMRKSWFIALNPHPTNPIVNAGYTKDYAPIVHELEDIVGGFVNWTRPGSGQKWLQIHFARNKEEMKLIVAKYARIPPNGRRYSYGAKATQGVTWTNIADRTSGQRNVEF